MYPLIPLLFRLFPARLGKDLLRLQNVFPNLIPLRLFLSRIVLPPYHASAEGATDVAHRVRACDELPLYGLVGTGIGEGGPLCVPFVWGCIGGHGGGGDQIRTAVPASEALADDLGCWAEVCGAASALEVGGMAR